MTGLFHVVRPAAAAAVAALLACGCATPPPEPAGAPGRATPESLASFGRGFLHEMEGRLPEAQEAYLRAIEHDPDYEPLYVRVASLRMARNDFAGAMEILRRLEQRHPRSSDVQRAMSRVSLAGRKPSEAIAFQQRAVDLAPTNSDHAAELCVLLARENREADAVAAARRSIASGPPPGPAMQRIAGALYLRTRGDKTDPALRASAAALFDQLEQRTRGDADARVAIGNVRLAAGDAAGGLAAYREAVTARPTDSGLYARIARILLAQEREDDVIAIVEEGVQKADDRSGLRRVLGGLYGRRAERTHDAAAARADREKAVGLLRQVARESAPGPELDATLGGLLARLGRDREAMESFVRVPQDAPSLRRELAMQFVDGDTNAAARRVKALADDPKFGRLATHYLAELQHAAGDEAGARATLERCAAAEPPEPAPYIRLAGWAGADTKAALEWIGRGLARMPDQPRLLQVRAVLEMLSRQFAKAEASYAKLEKLTDPDDLRSLLGLRVAQAVAMQADGREGQAADRLTAVLDPDYLALEIYVRLSFDIGRRLKDHEPARRVLRRVGELRPKDPAVRMYLGLYELTADAYPAAIAAFEDALRVGHENPESLTLIRAPFYFWFGSALERNKQYDRAEEMLERCIAMDRQYTEAFNYLAYTWAELGVKLDRATEYIRTALEREPGNGAYLDTLGWILFKQGRTAEALAELEKAVKALPEEDATVLDHVADALAKLGREAEALPKWKRSFVLDPKNEKVRGKLTDRKVDLAPLEREAAELQQTKDRDLDSLTISDAAPAESGEESGDEEEEDGADPMLP